ARPPAGMSGKICFRARVTRADQTQSISEPRCVVVRDHLTAPQLEAAITVEAEIEAAYEHALTGGATRAQAAAQVAAQFASDARVTHVLATGDSLTWKSAAGLLGAYSPVADR